MSTRIYILKARCAELSARFIDRHIEGEHDDPVNYVANTDDLAAFRLLVHAELEEFLEGQAKDGLVEMERVLAKGLSGIASNIGIIVLAQTLRIDLRFDQANWTLDAKATLKAAHDWIGSNNGIKDDSFTKLSLFAGKMPDEVDSSLSASLSSYGKGRGDVAHRSVSRVRTIYTARDEATTVRDLLASLDVYFM